jgi:multicomponent Na+:H+ antiporter subunit A
MELTAAVLAGFALALLVPWLHKVTGRHTGWIASLAPLAIVAYFLRLAPGVAAGQPATFSAPWVPSLGISLSFYVDGLSLLFALLIAGIGALVLIYSGGYMAGRPHLGRFYAYILFFMASMLGVVSAGNVLTMFVFWELTSISSYLLIGFDHDDEASRAAAWQALLVTAGGGLALLAGLVLLGNVAGSMEMADMLAAGDLVREHSLYLPILLLVLAGAFTKSAQFPFHFWLPSAMAAPTPVSAYLHSATMVKAGVFLLARLSPTLNGTPEWIAIVTTVGGVTMVMGAYVAFRHTDLKRMLAYSTVSVLGLLTMLLGLSDPRATTAAVVYLMAHALYKGALFLVAGAVDHGTGTRDITRLGGLRHAMPVTMLAAVAAALSMGGFPPLFGFIAKEMLYQAELDLAASLLLVAATVGASALMLAVGLKAGVQPFFGQTKTTPKHPHEAPWSMLLGPLLLASLGLVLGLLPGTAAHYLLSPAASAVAAQAVNVELKMWHGLNLALAMSAFTVLAGAAFYFAERQLGFLTGALDRLFAWGPSRWYTAGLKGLFALAAAQTRLFQSGYLRYYVLMAILTTVGLAGHSLLSHGPIRTLPLDDLHFHEVALAALILMAAMMAVHTRSRLAAIVALGVVGYGVALIFVLFGAPDLAMTQFMIETLVVILFVLVFYHLPGFGTLSRPRARARDAGLAILFGAIITALVLSVAELPRDTVIPDYYAQNSVPLAHGRNIVNVILVDFRALDTLGEITVLAVAGVGVFALLKLRLARREEKP